MVEITIFPDLSFGQVPKNLPVRRLFHVSAGKLMFYLLLKCWGYQNPIYGYFSFGQPSLRFYLSDTILLVLDMRITYNFHPCLLGLILLRPTLTNILWGSSLVSTTKALVANHCYNVGPKSKLFFAGFTTS